MRKVLKGFLMVLLAVVLIIAGYVAYVLVSYDRLEDKLPLEVRDAAQSALPVGEEQSVVTWNVGFGAYNDDYSFFMDGGTHSRGYSKEIVVQNVNRAIDTLKALDADIILLQEVDVDATRSYHVDQCGMVCEAFGGYDGVYAQNYDSAYLFYPIHEPHGASKSGLVTLVNAEIQSALRRSVPVEQSLMKLVDLDRCYSVSRIPASDGKMLCLYNLHLSAYTSDGSIATEQLKLLLADMQGEFAAGNYVIAGGDFNKDLPGNSEEIFGVSGEDCNWAQPLDRSLLPEGLALVDSLDAANPVPSCRNADKPYVPGESFVLTVDGFIVSDNVRVLSCNVEDEAFAVSDHNPVTMRFMLGE